MEQEEIEEAWTICTDETTGIHVRNISNLSDALRILQTAGFEDRIGNWAVNRIALTFLETAKDRLQCSFDRNVKNSKIEERIGFAHNELAYSLKRLQCLEDFLGCEGLRRQFALSTNTRLQALLPPPERIESLLRARYLLFDVQTPRGQKSLKHAREDELCVQLADMGGGRAVQDALTSIVFGRVDELLIDDDGALDTNILPMLIRKVEHAILPWLYTVAVASGKGAAVARKVGTPTNVDAKNAELARWRMQLMFHLHEAVAAFRTKQILDIIRAYPKSENAVDDLKKCLAATDYRATFINSLRHCFVQSLLNAGTGTSDILRQYVNLIKTLRVLDPTGIVLESVSKPIRSYLRHRPDTIRCIVNGMTVDGDLYAELQRRPTRRRRSQANDQDENDGMTQPELDDDLISIDGDYDVNGLIDEEAYERWEPEPIDAPSKESGWRPGGDAIATLVNIYGSSNLLVTEYRTLLADRLIHSLDLDFDKELQVLRLLQERFGEETMHECAIMLRDIVSSRETLALVPRDPSGAFETTVISKEFWPRLGDEEEFNVPTAFQEHMESFSSTFERVKDPRKLRWQHGHGAASMRLNFEDGRSVDVIVTPMQAAILLQFAEKKCWTIDDMQNCLGVGRRATIAKAFSALAGKGLLRAVSKDEYETVEHAGEVEGGVEEETVDGGAEEEEEQEENSMKVFESYIIAMLKNLKESPLERVHNMMKLFVQTPVYDKTQDQLAALLQRMVNEGKIEVQAGLYKFKDSST